MLVPTRLGCAVIVAGFAGTPARRERWRVTVEDPVVRVPSEPGAGVREARELVERAWRWAAEHG